MTASGKIKRKIKSVPKGKLFTSAAFLNLGSRAAIDQTLSRLVKTGETERVCRGVFVKPEISRYAGKVLPGPEEVARVIAKGSGAKVQIHGAEAVRRFGLSTQVPSRPVFYTSGPSKQVRVGNLEAQLKHTAARKLLMTGRPAGEALVALWYLGKEGVTPEVIAQIERKLPSEEFAALEAKKTAMPIWMAKSLNLYHEERQVA